MLHILYYQENGSWNNNETVLDVYEEGQTPEHCHPHLLARVWPGITDGHAQWAATLEDRLAVPCKLSILLPWDPAILFLGIYPKELKTYAHIKAHTWIFTAALFITVKTGKQPRHPLVSEWVNKVWYIQTTEYYSELKGNELSSHEKTWISVVLSCAVLSHFSCVQLFAILWTIARQAPLSMGFSRQEYWSALPGPSQIKK